MDKNYVVIEGFKGSPDGFQVCTFTEGTPFTHGGDLLKVAIDNDWVAEVGADGKPVKSKKARQNKTSNSEAEKLAAEKKQAITDAETALTAAKDALEKADDAGKEAAQKVVDDAQAALDALTA